jgi:hypothetical protein
MRWDQGERGGNIEDRRGIHPVAAGGIGIGGLVIAAIGLSSALARKTHCRSSIRSGDRLNRPSKPEPAGRQGIATPSSLM